MSDPDAERARLLIVDDEASVRSALRRTFRKENYKLSFAESAIEALEMLRDEQPELIISDHLMPQMTGLEFLKRCRLLYPDVGRVVLTGQAEMETVIGAINDGEVFRFLRKPWDDDEVRLTVHLAIQHVRLERENARLLKLLETHANRIRELETDHPGITDVKRDASGAIFLDENMTED
jgi:two-component system, probable response regulator PhcQ